MVAYVWLAVLSVVVAVLILFCIRLSVLTFDVAKHALTQAHLMAEMRMTIAELDEQAKMP